MQELTIGQLASAADVGVETVRFYERRGLLPDPPRRPSGYRRYPPEALERLRFIRRAKDLGFSLDEIGELLELRSGRTGNRSRVRARAEAKVADIDRRIADLGRIREALARLAVSCARGEETEECPILEALEGEAGEVCER